MTHKPTSDDIGMAVIFVVLAPVLSLAFFRFGMWVLGRGGDGKRRRGRLSGVGLRMPSCCLSGRLWGYAWCPGCWGC